MEHQEYWDDADFVSPAPPARGNGQSAAIMNAAPPAINSMTAVEQSRAVAEIQAALVVAATRPRDELRAQNRIMEACKRPSLAATAIYSYPKGGSQVEGPSIRLAETIARAWGNMDFGIKELSRNDGISEMEAYAWDLETNVRRVMRFQIRHWRDTKKGGYALKEERDIYELTANQGQRRVRSCILGVIPGDVIEAAIEQCNRTLSGQSDKPLKERIQNMIAGFAQLEVTEKMLVERVGHRLDAISEIELRQLAKVYNSVRDGYMTIEDAFASDAAKTTPRQEAKASGKTTQKTEGKEQPAPEVETAPESEEPYTPVPATVPCPNRDDKPVDEMECAGCKNRQGCPSWA